MASWSPLPYPVYLQELRRKRARDEPKGETETAHLGSGYESADTHSYEASSGSRTELKGKKSMLLDVGSKINVTGVNTVGELVKTAERFGYSSQIQKRKFRLNANGVGNGSAPCEEEAIIPIAVQYQDEPVKMDTFKTNIATGSGAAGNPGIELFEGKRCSDLVTQWRRIVGISRPRRI